MGFFEITIDFTFCIYTLPISQEQDWNTIQMHRENNKTNVPFYFWRISKWLTHFEIEKIISD